VFTTQLGSLYIDRFCYWFAIDYSASPIIASQDTIGESVHADRIYRTRDNRAWCKERDIRISGLPLGKPPTNVSKEKKKQAASDERIRNAIEGKFGACVNEDSA
jgi:hypothetical protein